MNPHHILVPSNRNPQLEMKFQNLNNSVESSVTGKREEVGLVAPRPGVDSRGRAEPHLAVGKCFVLGTGSNLKGGGIVYSDLPGDSSLARAFESKHGHLLLRGSSRSSIEEPGRVNSKVPYSGCKAEEEGEWAQPHQQPAFPTRKELKMKEESVCTIYGVE
ncbi:UNVERIFIED_CONTAM: hypothetical protein Scaly_3026100 [Sesamum calycinum]|uniref:Uncharacterized protein n=1 Tax=Sesamum calycinum TaxID=2727403 RepID=A0AAW2K6S5_9LAMI